MEHIHPYWNESHTRYAILVSYGYGAGWSTWNDKELAYDSRVVNFWLDHKDNMKWMKEVSQRGTEAEKEAQRFFGEIGYKDIFMGGFSDIMLEWMPKGIKWRLDEYDGSERIVIYREDEYTYFEE